MDFDWITKIVDFGSDYFEIDLSRLGGFNPIQMLDDFRNLSSKLIKGFELWSGGMWFGWRVPRSISLHKIGAFAPICAKQVQCSHAL